MSRTRPTGSQIEAADPARSNWVGANAGSGKTHVLTQRVARLLLADAAPEKILCLTYTKAAAGEMQNRLFEMLGKWAMAGDADLAAELAAIEGEEVPTAGAARLAEARRLFARALETPGGLKIQTIHAFCDAILRRFPLEAGVSARFDVADERQTDGLLEDVRSAMAAAAETGGDMAFDAAADRLNEDSLGGLVDAILARRESFPDDVVDRIAAHFPAVSGKTRQEVIRARLVALDRDRLEAFVAALSAHGGKTEAAIVHAVAQVARTDTETAVAGLLKSVLTGEFQPRKKGFPTKAVREQFADADQRASEMTDWAMETCDLLHAQAAAERAADLHRFALRFLDRYAGRKHDRALLDFDDLVEALRTLLARREIAPWVLYKLDQGIDHILVDEAQDTSPAQWDVIARLLEEFFSGEGARDLRRTVFVVGDEKQSIYSFQGADPQAFGRMRSRVADRLEGIGETLGRPDLTTSFRSAPAILEFVDAVFEGPAADGLMVDDAPVVHRAHRQTDQGRIDLWPLVEPEEGASRSDWWEPVDTVPATDARERLAGYVAAHIGDLVSNARLPARGGVPGRCVTPGDILVLVARRDRLARGIIRELKVRGLPVAGADRLNLVDELAVQDLLALVRFAVDPADDLTLATILRSPLCEVDESALFDVANGRDGTLWQALTAADERHPEEVAFLSDMLGVADFLRPYEFLERALGRHGGRVRFLARLGAEAEDPIDELLAQALDYEMREVPSLVGFIAWIEAANILVKREMEKGTGEVRVMTVHGAKGLEAPIVILPDTMAKPGAGNRGPLLLPAAGAGNAGDLMLWAGPRDQDDAVTADARAAHEQRQRDERRRLLYVALTRAEDWLILAGAGASKNVGGTWYEMLSAAMERVPSRELPGPAGLAQRFETGPPGVGEPQQDKAQAPRGLVDRPDWLAPAALEISPRGTAPSAHQSIPTGGAGMGREQALRYGTAVHTLLEHGLREAAATRMLAQTFPDLSVMHAQILSEIAEVHAMPEAAVLFGEGAIAETSLAIPGPYGVPVIGRADRIASVDGAIWVVDFKTDRNAAESIEDIPRGYVEQIEAYASALRATWPTIPVRAGIFWTSQPRLMWLS